MTWEYRESLVKEEGRPERQLVGWLSEGWELVGLHRKQRRGHSVVVAILRRPAEAPSRLQARAAAA